jgi:4-alpha-glucanotransferase
MPLGQATPASAGRQPPAAATRAALARLGVDRLVLSIHAASFPPGDDDLGHGAPGGARAADFLAWVASLGFTGVALGPGGITARDNPSPYDGTALSRNPLHLSFAPLVEAGLLDGDVLAAAVAGRPAGTRVAYRYAWATARALLAAAAARVRGDAARAAAVTARRTTAPWLPGEARFEAIAAALGHDDWRRWPADPPEDAAAAWAFEVGQWLADEQHRALTARAAAAGLALYADLPIGVAHRDRWRREPLFVPGYALGAPPSRTNPAGQPWGFPVLDPRALAAGGAARAFFEARLDRAWAGHRGLRIDHPHGWVCPWVYRTDLGDPGAAVRAGARLHESPDLPDHPALAAFARVRPDQLDRRRPRHDDGWVTALEPAQLDAYAALLDAIVARARTRGATPRDLMVEVLSTCPRPLAAVLARHGLGRFRVTQKARVADPADVYRSDQAAPADWIMIGNHDTPPLAAVLAAWRGTDEPARRAAYLGARLGRDPARLAGDERALACALVADLLVGPARQVLIFWVDLFGGREPYNRPGVVDPANWSLRVPADFAAVHAAAVARGDAPDIGRALAWALAARRLDRDDEGRALVAALAPGRSAPDIE